MFLVQPTIDMDIETFRLYCLAKPGASEHLPFDDRTLVFKVGGKIFALCDVEEFKLVVDVAQGVKKEEEEGREEGEREEAITAISIRFQRLVLCRWSKHGMMGLNSRQISVLVALHTVHLEEAMLAYQR